MWNRLVLTENYWVRRESEVGRPGGWSLPCREGDVRSNLRVDSLIDRFLDSVANSGHMRRNSSFDLPVVAVSAALSI